MKLHKPKFVTIPFEIFESNLTPNAKLLYGVLFTKTRKKREPSCKYSNTTLAELFRVNPPTISMWLDELEAKNLIIRLYYPDNTRKITVKNQGI